MTNNFYNFFLVEHKPLHTASNCEFKSISDLLKAGYELHHVGSRKGYHTRKYNSLYPYSGKFGTGYIVEANNLQSNRYGELLAYYIKK